MGNALFVSGFESLRYLSGDFQGFIHGNRPRQCFPWHVLHDQVVGADVVEGADVGMVEGGDGVGFLLEAAGEADQRSLNGDVAVEARVASAPDFAHAPFADRREDFVVTELFSGGQGH